MYGIINVKREEGDVIIPSPTPNNIVLISRGWGDTIYKV